MRLPSPSMLVISLLILITSRPSWAQHAADSSPFHTFEQLLINKLMRCSEFRITHIDVALLRLNAITARFFGTVHGRIGRFK